MRYLVMPIGSAGDVHPFMGLAMELKRRGHSVTVATNGYFQDLALRSGLDFEPLGSKEDFLRGVNHPDLWHPVRGFKYIYKNLLEDIISTQYDLVERLSSSGPLTVLTNCFGMGALCAQEKLGVPVISIHLQPLLLWSKTQPPQMPNLFGPRWFKNWLFKFAQYKFIDPTVIPSLNAFRATKGLEPIQHVMQWWHSKSMILCLFPSWYAPPQADWPSPLEQVDFPLWDERPRKDEEASGIDEPSEVLPEYIHHFINRKNLPIAFTPGSANVFGKDFFETGIMAARKLGKPSILLTRFADQLPDHLGEDVLHVPFVPLSLLLPNCSAFVHHGGIGSASQALMAGIPQLVWPLAHDQFDNAQRLQRLGVGDTLHRRWFTPNRLARKLRLLLSSEAVQASCSSVANRIQRTAGLLQAADSVIAFSSRTFPGKSKDGY